MRELLTLNETARLLRVTPETIRRYVRQGRIPAYHVGRGLRFDEGAVLKAVSPKATGKGLDNACKT